MVQLGDGSGPLQNRSVVSSPLRDWGACDRNGLAIANRRLVATSAQLAQLRSRQQPRAPPAEGAVAGVLTGAATSGVRSRTAPHGVVRRPAAEEVVVLPTTDTVRPGTTLQAVDPDAAPDCVIAWAPTMMSRASRPNMRSASEPPIRLSTP